MSGWNEQMYEKVPALAKVIGFEAPGAIDPVSKFPELVAVCGWVWLWGCYQTVVCALVCDEQGAHAHHLAPIARSAADPAVGGYLSALKRK